MGGGELAGWPAGRRVGAQSGWGAGRRVGRVVMLVRNTMVATGMAGTAYAAHQESTAVSLLKQQVAVRFFFFAFFSYRGTEQMRWARRD